MQYQGIPTTHLTPKSLLSRYASLLIVTGGIRWHLHVVLNESPGRWVMDLCSVLAVPTLRILALEVKVDQAARSTARWQGFWLTHASAYGVSIAVSWWTELMGVTDRFPPSPRASRKRHEELRQQYGMNMRIHGMGYVSPPPLPLFFAGVLTVPPRLV